MRSDLERLIRIRWIQNSSLYFTMVIFDKIPRTRISVLSLFNVCFLNINKCLKEKFIPGCTRFYVEVEVRRVEKANPISSDLLTQPTRHTPHHVSFSVSLPGPRGNANQSYHNLSSFDDCNGN